jgi:hypothetical protein
MGLAFDSANAQGVKTIMTQLVLSPKSLADIEKSNNLITRKLIGVNLQRASDKLNDGEISFGVIDSGKFSGKLTLVPNVATSGLWEVPMTDASVNGQPMGFAGRTSITDTGTSMLLQSRELICSSHDHPSQ